MSRRDSPPRPDPHDLACQHAVEMVTDYFERALPTEQAEVLELHLVLCDGCRTYVRTMKRSMDQTMEAGAKGIRMQMAGRLGGAEMARNEKAMIGSIPLSTLRAKIDYGFAEASTAQGNIGIKVWINNGDHLDSEEDENAANAQASKVSKKPTRKGSR